MAPVLQALADNHEHSMSQLRTVIAEKIGLTEEDLRAKIPSGAPLLASRVHWAVTYMYQAGLVRRPRRGVVEITPRGLDVLAQHPDRVDLGVLGQFAEFNDFRNRTRRTEQTAGTDEGVAEAPPRETVAAAVAEANAAVAEEVLERVREREPAFLERLVLDLLSAMGYAGAAGSAEHTGRPGDKRLGSSAKTRSAWIASTSRQNATQQTFQSGGRRSRSSSARCMAPRPTVASSSLQAGSPATPRTTPNVSPPAWC
jgi:restriction system protein